MKTSFGDDDFEIRAGNWCPATQCLAVEPGVVDFPGRCVDRLGHIGKHHAAISYVGPFNRDPLPITYWDNDDE